MEPSLERFAATEPAVTGAGRVLVVSYAFPPMLAQMAPIVAKAMAGLARRGFTVDVLSTEPFSAFLSRDESLLPYVEANFASVHRLRPPRSILGRVRVRLPYVATTPDLMAVQHGAAYRHLMDTDLEGYRAVISWSPFHSINPVLVRVKSRRPRVRWIAQFSDPWAANPLEANVVNRLWSRWREPQTVAAADFIVHSSKFSLELMARSARRELASRSAVVAHPFDERLFPNRPKARNDRIVLRYVGVLFGRRSPESLFAALGILFGRRPELRDAIRVELVGEVPAAMLETGAALALPPGTVARVPSVPYVQSLQLMYDADILLLIEADVRQNLFVPSKLSDYLGAGRPIVGLAPPGGSWDVLERLGCWRASPGDVDGISEAVEAAVDYVARGDDAPWCDEKYRRTFSGEAVAARFAEIIERV
jgi:glycosyltransferase involved in cell wall biosynthesis